MPEIIKQILDWLEVWALLIPLAVLFNRKNQPLQFNPVIAYLFAALAINLLIDISWKFKKEFQFPVWFQVNTYFYSVHSIVRFLLFSMFFNKLNTSFVPVLRKILPIVFVLFVVINFTFFEPFVNYWYTDGKLRSTVSSTLLSLEAILMLVYCLQYYFSQLQEHKQDKKWPAELNIVNGLFIFSLCSFPIYLFYNVILNLDQQYTKNIWMIQKICFLILCICIARAFLTSKNYTNAATASRR
jgi:hypothetical protein